MHLNSAFEVDVMSASNFFALSGNTSNPKVFYESSVELIAASGLL